MPFPFLTYSAQHVSGNVPWKWFWHLTQHTRNSHQCLIAQRKQACRFFGSLYEKKGKGILIDFSRLNKFKVECNYKLHWSWNEAESWEMKRNWFFFFVLCQHNNLKFVYCFTIRKLIKLIFSIYIHKSLNTTRRKAATICKLSFYFRQRNNRTTEIFIWFIKFLALLLCKPQNRFYFLKDITFSVPESTLWIVIKTLFGRGLLALLISFQNIILSLLTVKVKICGSFFFVKSCLKLFHESCPLRDIKLSSRAFFCAVIKARKFKCFHDSCA